MNILIYKIEKYLPIIVAHIRELSEVSIFFAFNRKDTENIVNDTDPQILFTKMTSELDKIFLKEISLQHPNLNIYDINEAFKTSKPDFREFQSRKLMNLEKIINISK